MPELPEVQTTVNGLAKTIVGLKIADVWSSYNSPYFKGSETIKDPAYFKKFRRAVIGCKIISVSRRAKNVLINLDNGQTILAHMKMTGHFLFDHYKKDDPFNGHIRFIITFSNGKHLDFSDLRKFGKITLVSTANMHESEHLKDIGPEPLAPDFTFEKFMQRISLRPRAKIKQVLLDQSIIAGIGNIYADESLWLAGIHPLERVENLFSGLAHTKLLYKAIKKTLLQGIALGGTSTSDYRNIHGEKGKMSGTHHAYQKTGERCDKRGCGGTIVRIKVGGRGTHYCDRHQRLLGQ